jgi:ABC-type sugar transport system, permease component
MKILKPMKTLKKDRFLYNLSIVIVVILALVNLFPLYWMISSSFKNAVAARVMPPQWFPLSPTVENYVELFKSTNALRWTVNSIAISIITTLLVCIVSSMAGYAFGKREFPLKNLIFWSLMTAMMIPYQVLLIPLFKLMINLKFVDTFAGIILPAVAFPFGIFLIRQFMQTIPSELLNAADIDGCSEIQKFTRVMLPVCKPGVGALAIFTFVSSWNDYLWQLIVIKTDLMKTLPLGVAGLQAMKVPNIAYLMAAATVASIPMVIIFIAFQKYFTKGITMGAVKG